MSTNAQAFRRLFNLATVITCPDCGRQIKPYTRPPNLQRLARLGCPDCGRKAFDYTFPENVGVQVQAILGRA
jgi:DNA-directed RNA polymerase subunit RPC12/RpoP